MPQPRRTIDDRTRKLLWMAADRCAFAGCDQPLAEIGPEGAKTLVGVECHIVAQRDHPSVARAPCLLTDDERSRHSDLILDRHSERNLVLMCGTHSTLIDDPSQPFSVDAVLEIKRAHEKTIERERDLGRRINSGELIGPALTTTLVNGITAIAEDSGAWDAKAMRELLRVDMSATTWLLEQLGQPESEAAIEQLITKWPDRVAHGCDQLAEALARKAERHGRYDLGATAWERLGDRASSDEVKADRLTRAAIDATVHGDLPRAENFAARAELADASCVRLKIHRLHDDRPPAQVLEDLRELRSDDGDLQALIEVQRARCHMLLLDLLSAEDCLSRASTLNPGSLNVRSLSVCLRVHRARVGVREDEEFPLGEIRAAKSEALALREELISLKRFSESGRILMLAADADTVERDSKATQETLALAVREEYAFSDGAHVLGDAALRGRRPDLALCFTEGHDDDGCRRIRATASLDLSHGADEEARRTLEELVAAGGPESEQAAGARLLACLDGVPFHEPSAQVLQAGLHARIAHQMRAFSLARSGQHAAAEAIADAHSSTRWGAELAVRLAVERGSRSRLVATAKHLLTIGADPFGSYAAGTALAQAGQLDEAATALSSVARNVNAPERLRDDAFNRLMRVHADRDAWNDAAAVWRDWERTLAQSRRSNVQLGAWHVRVANRTTKRS